MKKEVMYRIEEFILLLIILLNIFDFFKLLPGDLDFAKKVISWAIIAYLLYKISIARVIFGKKHNVRWLDLSLIISYFLLFLKNLTGFAISTAKESYLTKPLLDILANNAQFIDMASFHLGGIALIILSLYLAYFMEIKKNSLMNIIKEKGKVQGFIDFFGRSVVIFLIFISFFIIIFNLMMEWLAMAVDAPLLILALLIYLFIIIRHHKKFNAKTLIFKLGSVGEEFYEKFVHLFDNKKKIFLAISGLLILHLLTDLGIFIVPYLTGLKDLFYFSNLGEGHYIIWKLLIVDLANYSGFGFFSVIWIYIFNIIAILFFFLMPVVIWYRLYKGKGFRVTDWELSLFFSSVLVFILSPIFIISRISNQSLIGVDILTQKIDPLFCVDYIFALSLFIFILVFLLSRFHLLKEIFLISSIILIDLFFALYIFYYSSDWIIYYVMIIVGSLHASFYFIAAFFSFFLLVTSLFYVLGFVIFLAETKKEYKYIKY